MLTIREQLTEKIAAARHKQEVRKASGDLYESGDQPIEIKAFIDSSVNNTVQKWLCAHLGSINSRHFCGAAPETLILVTRNSFRNHCVNPCEMEIHFLLHCESWNNLYESKKKTLLTTNSVSVPPLPIVDFEELLMIFDNKTSHLGNILYESYPIGTPPHSTGYRAWTEDEPTRFYGGDTAAEAVANLVKLTGGAARNDPVILAPGEISPEQFHYIMEKYRLSPKEAKQVATVILSGTVANDCIATVFGLPPGVVRNEGTSGVARQAAEVTERQESGSWRDRPSYLGSA